MRRWNLPIRSGIAGSIVITTIATAAIAQAPADHAAPAAPGANLTPQQAAGMRPVDQAVEDLDPRAASRRYTELGNAVNHHHVRIFEYEPGTPAAEMGQPQLNPETGLHMPSQYQYRAPGVRAWMERPSYYVQGGPHQDRIASDVAPAVDGAFIERVPAGTVYDLIPPGHTRLSFGDAEQHNPAPDHRNQNITDHRVDTRLNTRLDRDSNDNTDAEAFEQMIRDPLGVESGEQ